MGLTGLLADDANILRVGTEDILKGGARAFKEGLLITGAGRTLKPDGPVFGSGRCRCGDCLGGAEAELSADDGRIAAVEEFIADRAPLTAREELDATRAATSS